MKKLIGITILGCLVLVGCASPAPTPSNEPVAPSNPPVYTQPGSLTPLSPATSEFALTVCPPMDALHLTQIETQEYPAVYVCGTDFETNEEYVREITVGAGELLEVYRTENAILNPAISCVAMLADPLIVWVTDMAGDRIPVYAPVDECGFPQETAVKAWERIVTTDITPEDFTSESTDDSADV